MAFFPWEVAQRLSIDGICIVSYLDDPRVLFAAERALLAWQRTAISLMGFGFVVERFGLFLRIVTNQPLSNAQQGVSACLGVVLLVFGALICVVSAIQIRCDVPPALFMSFRCCLVDLKAVLFSEIGLPPVYSYSVFVN